MQINKKYLLALSLSLLSSCSVGPDYEQPQFFTDKQLADSLHLTNSLNPVSIEWYREFNDAYLNRLITLALQDNPNVLALKSRLHQARATLKIVAVQYLPTVDIAGSYNKTKERVTDDFNLDDDYYQVGLDASWEIDIWGAGRRATERARAMLQATGAELANVRLSLTAEVAVTYYNWQQNRAQLELARKNLKLQKAILNLVRQRYDAGLEGDIALNQAIYLTSEIESQIPPLQTVLTSYQNALAVLCGVLPDKLPLYTQPSSSLLSKPFNFDVQRLYDFPVTVVRNRPDVKIAEQKLIAQNAQIGEAIARMFPNFSISALLGYQYKHISGLISSNHDMYGFAPNITLPIFHWGALLNNVKMQKFATLEQMQLYKMSLLTAVSEISNSISSVKHEYRRNQSAKKSKLSQARANALISKQYQEGLIDFSQLLKARQDYISAQNAYIASTAAIYKNIIEFYKTIGGGYFAETNTPESRKAVATAGCVHYKD